MCRILAASVLLGAASLLASRGNACAQEIRAATAPERVTLPNGRIITPMGRWIDLAPFPFTIAVRPDGRQLVIPSVGWPFSLNIVNDPEASGPVVDRLPPVAGSSGGNTHLQISSHSDPKIGTHMNVAYSPDGSLLYDPTGDSGAVDIYASNDWHHAGRIALDGVVAGTTFRESFSAAVVLSSDGKTLYALDQANWRIVTIDAEARRVVASVSTGANPLGIALSPDSRRLYVTNSGLFEYQLIPGIDPSDHLRTGLHFPPFGYPSKAAREGTNVEGHDVPGLGRENDPRGSSIWTYDLASPQTPVVSTKLRLGARITGSRNGVVGGASPSAAAVDSRHVYVSLSHQDAVAVVSLDGTRVEQEIALTPFTGAAYRDRQGRPLRGVAPFGLALDGGRLYVAESGINAVAVIDTASGHVLTHIPVGQCPAALAVSPDHRSLYVVNNKGRGSGPNRGGYHIGELEAGSLSVLPLPLERENFEASTEAVRKNNEAALTAPAPLPGLHHLFLVIRENRSFDEIFGDLANANGDLTKARYSMHGWVVRGMQGEYVQGEQPLYRDVPITPDAHALAHRFAVSDNFYVNSEVSVDGHRWAVGMAPAPWENLAWITSYGGRHAGNPASGAPGRRATYGGADGPMPEDEPEYGSLWEHVAGGGLPLIDYGEGLEIEGSDESYGTEPEGQRLVYNSPVPEPVYLYADRRFPTFNMGIPDQVRYAEFLRDFTRRSNPGYDAALTVIRLPNDHTDRPRPADGYPYRASFVADNDLALGEIVDTISHSAIWKDSAIFVYEDDSQSAADHVDAHRSPLIVISPYARRGFVSHRHTSMASVQKTIYELLNLGPLSLEDALSADLSDIFTTVPDLAPFTPVPEDARIFDPGQARIARPKNAADRARMLDCDDSGELAREAHIEWNPSQKPARKANDAR